MADVLFTTYPFLTSGPTATTPRKLSDRLGNNVKNVRDWGAVGNGTTDDRGRIQAAIDTLWQGTDTNRGTIYFPPGTYFISAPLSWNPPGGGENSIAFVGVGNASKITGNFNGGLIQRLYLPGALGPGPGVGPVLIANLWLNQDGEFNETNQTDPVLVTAGSFCIFITADVCVTVCNVRCTTKKHGIGITNTQGKSIYNCHVVCTGATANRFGIECSENGTNTACYVSGFTSGIRQNNIGGCTVSCVIENNDIGWEGGPYNSDPAAPGQGTQQCGIMSNKFTNNGTGIYWGTNSGSGSILIASNTIVGGGSSNYGFRSTATTPHDTIFAGNTISGTFAVAAITTANNNDALGGQIFLGTMATNSGAGVVWGEAQNNNAFSNTYINSNSTGPASRQVFAGLPTGTNGNRAIGATFWITDCNTATWSATAAAGGSNHVKVRWNGTNWTVVGK